MTRTTDKNAEIRQENKSKLRILEDFYVNAELDNLPTIIDKKKAEIVNKLTEFQEKYVKLYFDTKGNAKKQVNPYLVSTYFFKSVNPLASKEPKYNAEKLSIVWELYMYLVEQVNMNITTFQPTLSHFAKFAGLSLNTINNYKNCGDEDMIILCEKIYDECFNSNVSLAQYGILNEKSTMTRMKIENQVVEKATPQVKVNVETKVDLNEINKRLEEIQRFNGKIIELDQKRAKNG